MAENTRVRKEKWRLGINGVLTQVFAPMLYSFSIQLATYPPSTDLSLTLVERVSMEQISTR